MRPSCNGLVRRCVRPLLHKEDTDDDVRRKEIVVTLLLCCAPISAFAILIDDYKAVAYSTSSYGSALVIIATYSANYFFPRDRRINTWMLLGFLGAVLATDLYSVSRGDRFWSLAVLLMDCALVLDIADVSTKSMVGCIVTYLVVVAADRAITGLYRHVGYSIPWICDCSDPPCLEPWPSAVTGVLLAATVFLLDFYFTRTFATQLRQQLSMMKHAAEVTEDIAQLLSLYEVEECRALLQGKDSDELPARLKAALQRLLQNLEEYKLYLPEAMLVREGVAVSSAEPPGLGQSLPFVTMCFTDIQSSTELWEAYPQAMHTALLTHNDTVRSAAGRHAGYEVKVIGDSFMLAFASAADGCGFAFDVQAALADAKWPSDLQQHPLCAPMASDRTGKLLWSGPRVRIGVNCGPVRVEKNPVTGRCDYFGPPVNTAARVESCLRFGGLVGVTAAVLEELTPRDMTRLDPTTLSLGPQELKGVGSAVEVTILLPRRFAERKAVLTEPTLPRSQWGSGSSASALSMASSNVSMRMLKRRLDRVERAGLTRRKGTCVDFRVPADVDLDLLGTSLEEMLELVEQTADVTQGVVVSVLSLQCTVLWNASLACPDHYGQCLRALDTVWRASATRTVAGACSGELLSGNVSGSRKKYSTAIGGCVELSAALAEAAEAVDQTVLVATSLAEYCGTQGRTRRFAVWDVHSGGSLPIYSLTAPVADESWWDQLAASGFDGSSDDASLEPGRLFVLGAGIVPVPAMSSTSAELHA